MQAQVVLIKDGRSNRTEQLIDIGVTQLFALDFLNNDQNFFAAGID